MKRNDFILSLKQGFNMEHSSKQFQFQDGLYRRFKAEFLDSSDILRNKEAMPTLNVIYLVYAVNEN
jgi:hypothetical protein